MKNFLKFKRMAVLGYGSQGRAQAQNLRDAGITPIIGLPARSNSRAAARKVGFRVVSPKEAIAQSDVIAVLIPDHKHKELFDTIPPAALDGRALVFAHGLSIAFGLAKPPKSCDVILVAPHGPGVRIRELYRARKPFTAFWAVENDASGKAASIARAYAAAIGCPPKGLFKTTFREEAVGDIFGEQAVLCGGLVGLLESGFETLVDKGLSPIDAYLECVHQLDLIVDLIKRHGPAGMFERISKTAAFGSLKNKNRLFDSSMRNKMRRLYGEIESGRFARELLKENKAGMRNFENMLAAMRRSRLQKAHNKLRVAGSELRVDKNRQPG
jgi:ketol-acid reductoisomerase